VGYCFADAWACAYNGDDGFVGGVGRHGGCNAMMEYLSACCWDEFVMLCCQFLEGVGI
jgi:hypothetical protein